MKHYKIRQTITDRTTTAVDLYLKDISKYPLLKPGEEPELVKRVLEGDEKAKKKLIESNLRFVVSIAKQYQGKGIELADLISAGNVGLVQAIEHYDPNFNCKFISYASWWIRDRILKELINNGKTIRIPSEKIIKINRINKEILKYEQKYSQIPTISTLSELLSMDEEEIADIMLQCNISISSDNVVNSEGESESLFETLYVREGNVDEINNRNSNLSYIDDCLKHYLTKIEYDVITKSFGLGCEEVSLEEIGKENNLTKERIRQIKDKAIIKLRKCDCISALSKFV